MAVARDVRASSIAPPIFKVTFPGPISVITWASKHCPTRQGRAEGGLARVSVDEFGIGPGISIKILGGSFMAVFAV